MMMRKYLINNLININKKNTLKFTSIRATHNLPNLPFDPDLGLEPALSSKSLRLIYNDFQKHWTESLNKMIIGSNYENDNLEKIIMKTSQVLEERVVYNTAAQVWNSTFALKSLSKEKVEMNSIINQLILDSFGSFDKMVELFQTQGNSLFGGGFLWLVYENNRAQIIATSNSESPLYKFQPNINLDNTNNSPTIMNLEPQMKCLLGINLWGYAYLLDHGLDKTQYIKNILQIQDWNLIFKRFQEPKSKYSFKVEF
ncbi:manganese and iron superoxide dismutase [Neoconidiobolus thromboides FSU 785]|nr:manganese and iron superoxide dismutase [Neoconidiobolus thromboides FSU 785]